MTLIKPGQQPSSQEPRVLLDPDGKTIYVVTKYMETHNLRPDTNRFASLEKWDITQQLNQVLYRVYDKASLDCKKNRLEAQPIIVCLSGSEKFVDRIREIYAEMTRAGNIVLAPGFVGTNNAGPYSEQEKIEADGLHMAKIQLCDCLYVIDVDGYIGESTRNEIEFALTLNKQVQYLEQTEKNVIVK